MNRQYPSSLERRTRAILDAYGSSPACWPADERQQTLDCIEQSPELRAYQAELEELDRLIESDQGMQRAQLASIDNLQQRILERLAAKTVSKPSPPTQRRQPLRNWLQRPRLALALSGFAVMAMVVVTLQIRQPATPHQDLASYEAWSWYDITDQDLPASANTNTLSMTDLIDLETGEDGG